MYGVIVKNSGMWSFTTWVKKDGKAMQFKTKEEAQKVADELNDQRPKANNFNEYFAQEINKTF